MRASLFLIPIFAAPTLFAFVPPLPSAGQIHLNQQAYYGAAYRSVSEGQATKEQLSRILGQQRHNSVGYSTARRILFGEIYGQQNGKGLYVVDVYCDKTFHYDRVEDISRMGSQVNIEHTWPQSKFTGRFGKEIQKSDLHHLYPTDSKANNRRGNFHFGDVSEHEDRLDVQNCEDSRLGQKNGRLVFSPPEEHRGNVARSLFYFATRYQMNIPQSEEAILRQWHHEDPVDEEEIRRHEIVVKHQVVRNPFIDFPELVESIKDF